MAIWKDPAPRPAPAPEPTRFDAPSPPAAVPAPAPVAAPAPRTEAERNRKESLIASDITIEGKIEGTGSVRIAGKFKGDVNVQGDLTIEAGAKLTGGDGERMRGTAVFGWDDAASSKSERGARNGNVEGGGGA